MHILQFKDGWNLKRLAGVYGLAQRMGNDKKVAIMQFQVWTVMRCCYVPAQISIIKFDTQTRYVSKVSIYTEYIGG